MGIIITKSSTAEDWGYVIHQPGGEGGDLKRPCSDNWDPGTKYIASTHYQHICADFTIPAQPSNYTLVIAKLSMTLQLSSDLIENFPATIRGNYSVLRYSTSTVAALLSGVTGGDSIDTITNSTVENVRLNYNLIDGVFTQISDLLDTGGTVMFGIDRFTGGTDSVSEAVLYRETYPMSLSLTFNVDSQMFLMYDQTLR